MQKEEWKRWRFRPFKKVYRANFHAGKAYNILSFQSCLVNMISKTWEEWVCFFSCFIDITVSWRCVCSVAPPLNEPLHRTSLPLSVWLSSAIKRQSDSQIAMVTRLRQNVGGKHQVVECWAHLPSSSQRGHHGEPGETSSSPSFPLHSPPTYRSPTECLTCRGLINQPCTWKTAEKGANRTIH